MIVVDDPDQTVDDYLVAAVAPGDLVISRDVPLSSRLVELDAVVLDDRGNRYTRENVGERLSIHSFMSGLRNAGVNTIDEAARCKNSIGEFANAFDREITKKLRRIEGE